MLSPNVQSLLGDAGLYFKLKKNVLITNFKQSAYHTNAIMNVLSFDCYEAELGSASNEIVGCVCLSAGAALVMVSTGRTIRFQKNYDFGTEVF